MLHTGKHAGSTGGGLGGWEHRVWTAQTRTKGKAMVAPNLEPLQRAYTSSMSILIYHQPWDLRVLEILQPELNTRGFWELKVDSEFASFPTPSVHWIPKCTQLTHVPGVPVP